MTTKKSPANSVIAKRRCMYGILIGAMFVVVANLGITALLLYYINISKVSEQCFNVVQKLHNKKRKQLTLFIQYVYEIMQKARVYGLLCNAVFYLNFGLTFEQNRHACMLF